MAESALGNGNGRRGRRIRRRAAVATAFLLVAFALAWFFESQATTTVILVRYAESEAGDNPGLTEAGRQRAAELLRVLGDVDVVAGVDAIFTTRHRQTQETAEPLAKRLNLPMQVVDADEVRPLIERILLEHKGRIVLIVTNQEALPRLVRRLKGSKKVPPIEAGEHDNIYIVSKPWYGKVKTLRLRYGEPYRAVSGS